MGAGHVSLWTELAAFLSLPARCLEGNFRSSISGKPQVGWAPSQPQVGAASHLPLLFTWWAPVLGTCKCGERCSSTESAETFKSLRLNVLWFLELFPFAIM